MKLPSRNGVIFGVCTALVCTAAVTGIALNRPQRQIVIVEGQPITAATTAEPPEETEKPREKTGKVSTSFRGTVTTVTETSPKTETSTSPPETESAAVEAAAVIVFPIDVNLVTREELMAIDGIGEVTADNILNYRAQVGVITDMDMLLEVSGIGDKTLERLRSYLYVSEEQYRKITEATTASEVTEPPEQEEPQEQTETQTAVRQREPVEINRADAEEIAEKLMIDPELADGIVKTRELIGRYETVEALLYVDGMTKSTVLELKDYIILE